MEDKMLALRPGVQAAEEGDGFGLRLNGNVRLTKDRRQIVFLRALLEGPQQVENLGELLQKETKEAVDDPAFHALALAEFILNFKDYLEF
ncbi:hypothetical protein [Acidaminobacterium chupaoyuni]